MNATGTHTKKEERKGEGVLGGVGPKKANDKLSVSKPSLGKFTSTFSKKRPPAESTGLRGPDTPVWAGKGSRVAALGMRQADVLPENVLTNGHHTMDGRHATLARDMPRKRFSEGAFYLSDL